MCTHRYIVPENVPFRTSTSLILLISASFFFLKKGHTFLEKTKPLLKAIACVTEVLILRNVLVLRDFTQSNSYVRDVLVLFLAFVSQKVAINENVGIKDHLSRALVLDCFKSTIN